MCNSCLKLLRKYRQVLLKQPKHSEAFRNWLIIETVGKEEASSANLDELL